MTEVENKFLQNLEYQIRLKEESYETFKKIPVFTEQVKQFDKTVVNLAEKFEEICIRDKYQIIIAELDKLIKDSKTK
ncbi:MAG: hypothetical protein ACFFCE_05295 [Promethearchaeota archaeon]